MLIPTTTLFPSENESRVHFGESETKINLLRAFAGESQARNRYTFAAAQAKKEGYALIADVFNYTANQEKEHAEIFFNHLKKGAAGENITIDAAYPIDRDTDVFTLLREAQHNEFEEFESAYPAFVQTAEDEGFAKIAAHFRMIAEIEKTHGERFGMFASLIENDRLFIAEEETRWVCLNCGNVHRGIEAPMVCPVCDHDRGYFIREELAPFTR